jgi:hypothetical protein
MHRQRNVYITVHTCQLNEHVYKAWEGLLQSTILTQVFISSNHWNRLTNNITTNSDYKDTFTAWMTMIPGLCFLWQNFRAEIKTSVDNLYVPVVISCLHNVEEDLRMHRLARQQDTVTNNDCVTRRLSWIKKSYTNDIPLISLMTVFLSPGTSIL